MATPIFFTVYESDGVTPKPGASPTFTGGYFGTTAGTRTPPSIVNMGVGEFSFTPTDADEEAACVAKIVTGATPAFVVRAVHAPGAPFAAVEFYNADGTAITSGTPTTPAGSYQKADGTALTIPALVAVTGKPSLWTLTPGAGDLDDGGVAARIAAPAAKIPAFWDVELIPGAQASGELPVVDNFSPAVMTSITATTPIAFDVTVSDGTPLANVSISVEFTGLGIAEEAFDGAEFADLYLASSIRTGITNGFRFTLNRRAGWPANPKVKIRAVSITGAINA